jgi:hypothetical protein
MPSILFHSSYCVHSKQILNEINRSPIKSTIKLICIDSQSVRSKLPKYITSVPSIVVGETNQILVGNNILNWLKAQNTKFSQHEQSHNNIKSIQHPKPKNNAPSSIENIGPDGWHTTEMGGFSDMYSFLEIDNSAKGDGGRSMVHNFETINGQSCGISPGPPTNTVMNPVGSSNFGGSLQETDKEDDMNKQMQAMMAQRESAFPNTPTRS